MPTGYSVAARVTCGVSPTLRAGSAEHALCADGEIIGTPDKPVLFNGRSSAAAGYTVKGTTDSWRNSVARLVDGNYSMMTGIGAALAAPLIGLADAKGFGIHFYEQ